MLIAYDAAAFQQGFGGGILNVSVGFLNAAAAHRDVDFILVIDPAFGPLRKEFTDKLTFEPKVLSFTLHDFDPSASICTTQNPAIEIFRDGSRVEHKKIENGFIYEGPTPKNSLVVASRSDRPIDIRPELMDERKLGFAFYDITVTSTAGKEKIDFSDNRLLSRIHKPEAYFSWTDGLLAIPPEVMPDIGEIKVEVSIAVTARYRLFQGRLDRACRPLTRSLALLTQQRREKALGDLLSSLDVDYFFVNHFLPFCPEGVRTVIWAYDLAPLLHPEYFGADAIDNFKSVIRVLRKSDLIFSISEFTTKTIIDQLEIEKSRILTSWIGASSTCYRRPASEVEVVKQKHAVAQSYMLCVGTLEPRKNHVGLIRAYAKALSYLPAAPDLVIVGNRGWGYDQVDRTITELGVGSRVRIISGLSDDEVAALYSGAVCLCYPSFFEGFGLPVLEAMICQIPIITSKNTSMSSFSGSHALLVDPWDTDDICQAMVKLCTTADLRVELVMKANAALDRFRWPAIADVILRSLREVTS